MLIVMLIEPGRCTPLVTNLDPTSDVGQGSKYASDCASPGWPPSYPEQPYGLRRSGFGTSNGR